MTIERSPVLVGATFFAAMTVGFCFLPGVGTGYVFDDFTSVVPLHALRSDASHFWFYVFGDESGPLGRPLAMATFALEQVLFDADASQSQIVSIALHGLNAILVLVFTGLLARTLPRRDAWPLALIVALIWACAPQKVSSVLYVVQRMTILSGFFAVLALSSYTWARLRLGHRCSVLGFSTCIFALIVAPLAKETGVLLIFYIAALELLVLNDPNKRSDARLRHAASAILCVGLVGFTVLGIREYLQAEITYAERNFTFAERVFSTPIVLLDYAAQFFVPDTMRLGILHDDFPMIQSGEFNPRFWMASTGLVCILTYILYSVIKKKRSIAAFGLFLFILGHGIESTFLPLEVYFEHRNYLPSLGLALIPFSVGLSIARNHNRRTYSLFLFAALSLVGSLAFSTYNTAAKWESNASLVGHHLTGHPESSRAHTEAALLVASGQGYDEALAHLALAYSLSKDKLAARSLGYGDLGLMRVLAACLAGKSLSDALPGPPRPLDGLNDPFRSAAPRSLLRMHVDQVCDDADWEVISDWVYGLTTDVVSSGRQVRWRSLTDLAALEKQIGQPLRAYIYAAMASAQAPDEGMPLLLMADAAITLGDRQSLIEAVDRLRGLGEAGALGRAERLFLEQLTASRGYRD